MSDSGLHQTRTATIRRGDRPGRTARLALLLVAFAAGGTAATAEPTAPRLRMPSVQYSADIRIAAGQLIVTGHINYTPEKERRTLELEKSALPAQPMIVRRDKKAIWILNPAHKSYYRMPATTGAIVSDGFRSQTLTEKTEVGRETLDGVEVTKYRVVLTNPGGIRFTGHVWITRDEIMLKVAGETFNESLNRTRTLEIVLTNLELGPQPADLFEVPPGYRQVSPSHPALGAKTPPPRRRENRPRQAGAPAGDGGEPTRP